MIGKVDVVVRGCMTLSRAHHVIPQIQSTHRRTVYSSSVLNFCDPFFGRSRRFLFN